MLLNYFKNLNPAHTLIMIAGIIFIGFGIAVFKLSGLGIDPFNGMAMALADYFKVSFTELVIFINLLVFIIEFIFGRKLIGIGTVVNAVFLGYVITFFYECFAFTIGSLYSFWQQLSAVAIGLIICGFGISLYQAAKTGVSPYDSMALILFHRSKRLKFFFFRISTDSVCAAVCFIAGGTVNIGTLAAVFGTGPIVNFFDAFFTRKLMRRIDAAHCRKEAPIVR